jgi:hypothetical protein
MTDKADDWTQRFANMAAQVPGEGVEESLLARIQELRAENERHVENALQAADRLEQLRAENEQLRSDLHFKCRGEIADRDEQLEDARAEIERLLAVKAVAEEVQRGSETWYVPGDILDRLNAALSAWPT